MFARERKHAISLCCSSVLQIARRDRSGALPSEHFRLSILPTAMTARLASIYAKLQQEARESVCVCVPGRMSLSAHHFKIPFPPTLFLHCAHIVQRSSAILAVCLSETKLYRIGFEGLRASHPISSCFSWDLCVRTR